MTTTTTPRGLHTREYWLRNLEEIFAAATSRVEIASFVERLLPSPWEAHINFHKKTVTIDVIHDVTTADFEPTKSFRFSYDTLPKGPIGTNTGGGNSSEQPSPDEDAFEELIRLAVAKATTREGLTALLNEEIDEADQDQHDIQCTLTADHVEVSYESEWLRAGTEPCGFCSGTGFTPTTMSGRECTACNGTGEDPIDASPEKQHFSVPLPEHLCLSSEPSVMEMEFDFGFNSSPGPAPGAPF